MTQTTETKNVRLVKQYIQEHFIAFCQFKSVQDFESAKGLIFLMIQLEQLDVPERCELRRYCDEIFYREDDENND
jgi:hypothetical protein